MRMTTFTDTFSLYSVSKKKWHRQIWRRHFFVAADDPGWSGLASRPLILGQERRGVEQRWIGDRFAIVIQHGYTEAVGSAGGVLLTVEEIGRAHV